MTDEEKSAATELPGKVWICPGCGNRYGAPTTCDNEHAPLECEEFDIAPGEAAVHAADDEAPAPEPEPEPADTNVVKADGAAHDALQAAHDALDQAHAALDTAKQTLDDLLAGFAG